MSNEFSLEGRGAVVTGAAMGIGKVVALRLAVAGAAVVCADLSEAAAQLVADEIIAAGGRAKGVGVNVAKKDEVIAAAGRADEFLGGTDILVNCAGITFRSVAEDFPEAEWDRIMAVNLKGTFLCCQAFGKSMIAKGAGKIVNFASIGGMVGYPDTIAYLASKGGVVQVTRGLGVEWAKYGINVNAIAPSVVDTPMQEKLRLQDPAKYDFLVSGMAIKRAVHPNDIASAVLFLSSDGANFITGHILPVDGGYLAR